MIINECTIAKSLNKAYLKQDIAENDFTRFKNALVSFFQSIKYEESEEYQKNTIAEFLREAFYKDKNLINTSERIDLAIYNSLSKDSHVSVLMEVKSTRNKSEMFSTEKPNVKSFHEIISYYLEQSLTQRNKEIKNLIITNTDDWYIFDGGEIEKIFYSNTFLINKFSEHREDLFGANTTQWFYNYLRDEIIPNNGELNCTKFKISDFKSYLNDPQKEEEMIELFKILSPEHLLKKPFANDSNTLDSQFYDELLHIIGLEEKKEAGKKVLLRLSQDMRNSGSLLENTIHQLKQKNALDNLDNLVDFGNDEDEQYFSVGLELCITWLNRIIFLKLLESQLIKFNNDFDYKFLSSDKVTEFDDLNELFFDALALKLHEREKGNRDRFKNIPYLNSSLFDMTLLEKKTIIISNLKDRNLIPVFNKTVLKTISGDRTVGSLKLHKYLLDFLDAYNFSSDRKATIQATNKTIINSSVLGLIFEKLNGYKDGSYFTPSYITMYMCREAISKAVVNKFNAYYKWNCNSLEDLYNRLETSSEKLKEYNMVFNTIRLVDPAVGSGHFLVSALNELIRIKHELEILIDVSGKRLKGYKFYIENDELIIIDDEDKIFTYLSPNLTAGAKRDDLQRVQQIIFHEKQTIIESCLFGVDINPKSVAIARLRLWIELLKSAYYRLNEENQYELEVLPNIDINIKEGNSLISRFPVDDNSPISISDAKIIPLYRNAVQKYKNINDAKVKVALRKDIESFKSQLRGMIITKSIKVVQLADMKENLKTLINQTDLFNATKTKKDEHEFTKKVNSMTLQIEKLEKEVEDIKSSPVYHNAFEWRFEFPEVLDDKGNFTGFDVVICNPPYGLINKKQNLSISLEMPTKVFEHLKSNSLYSSALGGVVNVFRFFILNNLALTNSNGFNSVIIPLAFTNDLSMVNLRKYLFENTNILNMNLFPERDNSNKRVFEEVKMSVCILLLQKNKSIENQINVRIHHDRELEKFTEYLTNTSQIKILDPVGYSIPILHEKNIRLITNIYSKYPKLGDFFNTYDGEIHLTQYKDCISKNSSDQILLKGAIIGKYLIRNKMSQGVIEFLNKSLYLSMNKGPKSKHHNNYRIAMQRITGVNEKIRIKATIIPPNNFLANSIEYIIPKNINYNYDFLLYSLSILNSKLLNYFFKVFSTNSNVNGYELKSLPFIENKESQQPFVDLVDIILTKKDIGENTDFEERKIDVMVYKLYELTYDEVKIIDLEFDMSRVDYETITSN